MLTEQEAIDKIRSSTRIGPVFVIVLTNRLGRMYWYGAANTREEAVHWVDVHKQGNRTAKFDIREFASDAEAGEFCDQHRMLLH